ncbi:MAG: TRAP transporter small permease subunit [Reyranella sp.]|uniref:TRAP transporter small permease subunit n=1 Tax=Reyranella sp. TaxID=1929291 RepID=UPI003D0BED19
METAWNLTAKVSRIFAWLGGVLLLAATIVVSAEVVSRKVLSVLFSGSDEIAAYLFAVGTSWSLAHVLVTRGHVRIDALYLNLPARVRAGLDLLSLLVLGLVALAMLDRAFDLTLSNYLEWNRANTPLRTPLSLPQAPWVFGLALFVVSILVAVARTAMALWRGDLATASQTAGVASQDEEIESELSGLGIAFGHHPAPSPSRAEK